MSDSVKEKKTPFPFSMVEAMMPMYPYIAVMGWMVVVISFLVSLVSLSPAVSDFYSDTKSVREGTGSKFVDANQQIHVLETWVPEFKFLGLGLGLLAITMALGVIALRLRAMGEVVTSHIPENVRPSMPEPPQRVRIFQISAMMGIMILMITFIIGLVLAFTVVSDYWGEPIQTLNGYTGSDLDDLGTVASFKHWLGPLRMIGMALLLTAITIALSVITGVLKFQSKLLSEFTAKNK
jgi:hypothetical protein